MVQQPWFASGQLRRVDYVHHEIRESLPLSIKCRFAGASRYSTRAGDYLVDDHGCLLLNPGRTYAFHTPVGCSTYSFNVFFPAQWIAATLDSDEPVLVHETYYRYTDAFIATIEELMARVQAGDPYEETLIELLGRVLDTQHRYARQVEELRRLRPATQRRLAARLHRARDQIYADYALDLTLDEIARGSALSKFHLVRFYREHFGVTPIRDQTRKRMEIARTLLRDEQLDVAKVGAAVGYQNTAAFITAFRRAAGATPGRYRSLAAAR